MVDGDHRTAVDDSVGGEPRDAEMVMNCLAAPVQTDAAVHQRPLLVGRASRCAGPDPLGEAASTGAAAREEGHDDPAPDRDVVDVRPCGLDDACGFMTEKQRNGTTPVPVDH